MVTDLLTLTISILSLQIQVAQAQIPQPVNNPVFPDSSLDSSVESATNEVTQGVTPVSGSDGNLKVKKILAALRTQESGGNYAARGKDGEYGAYQYMPGTWSELARLHLGNSRAPMTKENQDIVTTKRVQGLLDKGYGVFEIGLIWNGGEPKVKKGVTKNGIRYDSGAYARKIVALAGV